MAHPSLLSAVLFLLTTPVTKCNEAVLPNSSSILVNTGNQTLPSGPEALPLPELIPSPVPITPMKPPELLVPQAPIAVVSSLVEDSKIATKQVGRTPKLDDISPSVEQNVVKKVLGSTCSNNSECISMNNTSCTNEMCNCIAGFIPSTHSLDKCVKVPNGLGDECEEEAQCNHAVPNSDCRNSKCECPPNYIYGEGKCWEKQMLGGKCSNNIQCEDITFSMCVDETCVCEAPLIPSPINKCLQPAGKVYLAPCVEDIQCTYSYGDEARCSNSQCRCTNNYHYNGTTCIADKKLGAACSTHEDCAISEIDNHERSRMCLEQSCACATGYIAFSGEEICTKSSGEELAVSLTWVLCIIVAKYYLS